MKVHKCSEAPVKAPPKKLSWNEIIQSEGVYKRADTNSTDRLIVLIYRSNTQILLHSNNRLEPASPNWSTACYEYVRVENARVFFEIREE